MRSDAGLHINQIHRYLAKAAIKFQGITTSTQATATKQKAK